MAIVNLASFEIDTSKAQKEIEKLQETMFSLNQRQKSLRDESKALEKAIKDLGEVTEENVGEYENLVSAQQSVFKAHQELAKQTSVVRAEYNSLVAVQKTRITTDQKTLSMSEAITKSLETEVKNINSAKASISQLTKLRNQLNPEIAEEKELLDKLNDAIDENNEFIRNNSSALEKQKINIGNYTKSIIDAYKELEEQKQSLEDVNKELVALRDSAEEGSEEWKIFNQQINNNNTQINILIANMADARGEMKDFSDVTSLASGGLGNFIQAASNAGGSANLIQSAGTAAATSIMGMVKASLAFIATPIGAAIALIVAAFLLLKNAMNSNSETATKINAIFAKLSGVLSGVLKAVEPLGTFIVDVLIFAFEKWASVVSEVFDVVTGLTAAVLDFFGATEQAEAVKNFNKELRESADMAEKIFEAEQKVIEAQRAAKKTMLEYQNEAEKLRQIRDDDSRSTADRIKANDALGVSLQKQMAIEKSLATESLRLAQLRIKAVGGITKANDALKDALAEAETELIDIEERITGQVSEQLTNRNALLKEAAEKAEEIRQKAYEKELKRRQEDLKLFQEQQGFKSKTLEEELKIFEETSKRETEILKLQLKNRKISQTEYNTEILKLQNEQGLKLAEIAIQNAEIELKAYKELHDEKYLENKRFDEELLNYELARQADLLKRDKEFAQLQLDQGIINKTEYNQAMLDLDRDYEEQRNAVRETYDQQRRENEAAQKVLDAEARMLDIQETSRNEFEIQRAQEQLNFEQQQVDLAEQSRQGLISTENYNKAVENLERQHALVMQSINDTEQTAKLDLMKDTFGGIAEMVGENTAMGKAAGIASATINTYQGVSEVWKSPAVFPEPYNTILKGVQTGITVASGLKAVKSIASVKVPSAGPIQGLATGGIVGDGFEIQRANGDDRLATLMSGEAVLSRSSRAFMGDSMLAAAGVPMSGAASSTVGASSPMMDEIAQAVEQGAARGSEQGSRSGSSEGIRRTAEDRLVQQSATF